jgi:hypothetical protein
MSQPQKLVTRLIKVLIDINVIKDTMCRVQECQSHGAGYFEDYCDSCREYSDQNRKCRILFRDLEDQRGSIELSLDYEPEISLHMHFDIQSIVFEYL